MGQSKYKVGDRVVYKTPRQPPLLRGTILSYYKSVYSDVFIYRVVWDDGLVGVGMRDSNLMPLNVLDKIVEVC